MIQISYNINFVLLSTNMVGNYLLIYCQWNTSFKLVDFQTSNFYTGKNTPNTSLKSSHQIETLLGSLILKVHDQLSSINIHWNQSLFSMQISNSQLFKSNHGNLYSNFVYHNLTWTLLFLYKSNISLALKVWRFVAITGGRHVVPVWCPTLQLAAGHAV